MFSNGVRWNAFFNQLLANQLQGRQQRHTNFKQGA